MYLCRHSGSQSEDQEKIYNVFIIIIYILI